MQVNRIDYSCDSSSPSSPKKAFSILEIVNQIFLYMKSFFEMKGRMSDLSKRKINQNLENSAIKLNKFILKSKFSSARLMVQRFEGNPFSNFIQQIDSQKPSFPVLPNQLIQEFVDKIKSTDDLINYLGQNPCRELFKNESSIIEKYLKALNFDDSVKVKNEIDPKWYSQLKDFFPSFSKEEQKNKLQEYLESNQCKAALRVIHEAPDLLLQETTFTKIQSYFTKGKDNENIEILEAFFEKNPPNLDFFRAINFPLRDSFLDKLIRGRSKEAFIDYFKSRKREASYSQVQLLEKFCLQHLTYRFEFLQGVNRKLSNVFSEQMVQQIKKEEIISYFEKRVGIAASEAQIQVLEQFWLSTKDGLDEWFENYQSKLSLFETVQIEFSEFFIDRILAKITEKEFSDYFKSQGTNPPSIPQMALLKSFFEKNPPNLDFFRAINFPLRDSFVEKLIIGRSKEAFIDYFKSRKGEASYSEVQLLEKFCLQHSTYKLELLEGVNRKVSTFFSEQMVQQIKKEEIISYFEKRVGIAASEAQIQVLEQFWLSTKDGLDEWFENYQSKLSLFETIKTELSVSFVNRIIEKITEKEFSDYFKSQKGKLASGAQMAILEAFCYKKKFHPLFLLRKEEEILSFFQGVEGEISDELVKKIIGSLNPGEIHDYFKQRKGRSASPVQLQLLEAFCLSNKESSLRIFEGVEGTLSHNFLKRIVFKMTQKEIETYFKKRAGKPCSQSQIQLFEKFCENQTTLPFFLFEGVEGNFSNNFFETQKDKLNPKEIKDYLAKRDKPLSKVQKELVRCLGIEVNEDTNNNGGVKIQWKQSISKLKKFLEDNKTILPLLKNLENELPEEIATHISEQVNEQQIVSYLQSLKREALSPAEVQVIQLFSEKNSFNLKSVLIQEENILPLFGNLKEEIDDAFAINISQAMTQEGIVSFIEKNKEKAFSDAQIQLIYTFCQQKNLNIISLFQEVKSPLKKDFLEKMRFKIKRDDVVSYFEKRENHSPSEAQNALLTLFFSSQGSNILSLFEHLKDSVLESFLSQVIASRPESYATLAYNFREYLNKGYFRSAWIMIKNSPKELLSYFIEEPFTQIDELCKKEMAQRVIPEEFMKSLLDGPNELSKAQLEVVGYFFEHHKENLWKFFDEEIPEERFDQIIPLVPVDELVKKNKQMIFRVKPKHFMRLLLDGPNKLSEAQLEVVGYFFEHHKENLWKFFDEEIPEERFNQIVSLIPWDAIPQNKGQQLSKAQIQIQKWRQEQLKQKEK